MNSFSSLGRADPKFLRPRRAIPCAILVKNLRALDVLRVQLADP
jgi:hypothetical protein